jgi:NADPH:quinone reductase-like Zn-dependent oxidoreductase
LTELPTTVTAAYITATGPAENIRLGELPMPSLGPTDVLVRAEVVAVNNVDTFVRSGSYQTALPMPFIVGRDVVGVVAALGPGVVGFAVGDGVWCNSLGHAGRQGSFATYVVISAERLYHLPDGVDPVNAVAALHAGATAYLGLFQHAEIKPGQTIVVGGAGGSIGSAVVQLAATAGARVLATASPRDVDWCHSSGAEQVFDYGNPDVEGRIAAAAPDGVDVYIDTSGHHNFDAILPLLGHGARIVLIAGRDARPVLPVGAVYTRDISLRGFVISKASVSELAAAAQLINRLLPQHILRVRVAEVMSLADAAKAHRMVESRQVKGRIVLRVWASGS